MSYRHSAPPDRHSWQSAVEGAPCPLAEADRVAMLAALGLDPAPDPEVLEVERLLAVHEGRPVLDPARVVREVEQLRGAYVALTANESARPTEAEDWRAVRAGQPLTGSAAERYQRRVEVDTAEAAAERYAQRRDLHPAEVDRIAAELRAEGRPPRGRPRDRVLAAVVGELALVYERTTGRAPRRSVPTPTLAAQLQGQGASEGGAFLRFVRAAMAGLPPPRPPLEWAVRDLLARHPPPPRRT